MHQSVVSLFYSDQKKIWFCIFYLLFLVLSLISVVTSFTLICTRKSNDDDMLDDDQYRRKWVTKIITTIHIYYNLHYLQINVQMQFLWLAICAFNWLFKWIIDAFRFNSSKRLHTNAIPLPQPSPSTFAR